jgi:hypothetical protein
MLCNSIKSIRKSDLIELADRMELVMGERTGKKGGEEVGQWG